MPSRHHSVFISALIALGGISSLPARAADYRYWLAEQRDKPRACGFYLALEGNAKQKETCHVSDLRPVFAAGNGQTWKYIIDREPLGSSGLITIKAVLQSGKMELYRDGKPVGSAGVAPVPATGDLVLNSDDPHCTSGSPASTDFTVAPESIKITVDDRVAVNLTNQSGHRSIPNILAVPEAPGAVTRVPFTYPKGHRVELEIRFRLVDHKVMRQYAPYFDKFGQWRYGNWPGKLKSETEFPARIRLEKEKLAQWGKPEGFDPYGGYRLSPWKEKPTGFFRVVKKNDFWWLISPEGNPCFYLGLCAVGSGSEANWPPTPVSGRDYIFEYLPPKTGQFREAWLSRAYGQMNIDHFLFRTANLIRKYGEDWRSISLASTAERLKVLGFSGGGKWCFSGGNDGRVQFSWFVTMYPPDDLALVRHADVFDPRARARLEGWIAERCRDFRTNPWVVGLSCGNEGASQIFNDEITKTMAMKSDVPAKRAFVDYALAHLYGGSTTQMAKAWELGAQSSREDFYRATTAALPMKDVAALRDFYFDRYHEFLYTTFKKHDPNHLFFGGWLSAWQTYGQYPRSWQTSAKYCDVIGFDHYARSYMNPKLAAFIQETNKPVLDGEFGFSPTYNADRGFARRFAGGEVLDDKDAGECYKDWIRTAARDKYSVGLCYYNYYGAPASGRGPGSGPWFYYGERLDWGLVDMTDTLKWDFVERVREANLQATRLRLEASK